MHAGKVCFLAIKGTKEKTKTSLTGAPIIRIFGFEKLIFVLSSGESIVQ